MGGLPRRTTVIEQARAAGPTFVVDAGDAFWKNARPPEHDRAQLVVKAELIAASFALAGIDAMLPAAGDLALGNEFLARMRKEHDLPYVATNLTCGDLTFPSVLEVERGGVKMAIFGVVGSEADRLGCTHTDAIPALTAAMSRVTADVRVVLSDLSTAENEALTEAVPAIDFLVTAERKQFMNPETLPGGGLHLGAGSRGKHVGALTFTLVPDGKGWADDGARERLIGQKDRYVVRLAEEKAKVTAATEDDARKRAERQVQFVEKMLLNVDKQLAATAGTTGLSNRASNKMFDLDDKIADHPAATALLAAAKEKLSVAVPQASGPRTGPFAGSEACQGCHAAEYAQWQTTPHSHAWQTLVSRKSTLDPACFACHATGAHHPEGPRTGAEVGPLTNVGCESCHGPGKDHAAKPGGTPMTRSPAPGVCLTCHDGVNDEGRFEPEVYRPKVVHRAAP